MDNRPEADGLGEGVFAFVKRTEESVLDTGRKWANAVGDAMPVELRVARRVMNGAFDLTERVLKVQRELAYNVIEASRPVRLRGRTKTPATMARPRTARASRGKATPRVKVSSTR